MNIKEISVVVGISLIVALAVSYFLGSNTVVERVVERSLGAISGPDIFSSYLSINGVRTEYRSMKTGAATTTPCAFAIPAGTSTLQHFSFHVSSTTGTNAAFDIGTSTTPFSTTTVPMLFKSGVNIAVAAGEQSTYVWNAGASTTQIGVLPSIYDVLTGKSTNVLNASTSGAGGAYGSYLVVKVGAQSFIGGTCKATFQMVD